MIMKAITLTFLLQAFIAAADQQTLTMEGVSAQDDERMKAEIPAAFEGELTYSKVDEMVRWLQSTGRFERVLAEESDSGKVRLTVRPIRMIASVRVKGQRSFRESQLLDVVHLEPGTRFERKRILEAGERLKEFYGDQGFFNTVIEVSFARTNSEQLIITFVITENSPTRIKSVLFQSTNGSLNERLMYHLKGYRKDTLTTQRQEQIIAKGTSFLLKNRFLKAQLEGPEYTYNTDRTQADLLFRIDEPFRYEFYVDGNSHLSESEIYRVMGLDSIERRMTDPGGEIADRIRSEYLRSGFPNVEVKHKTTELAGDFIRKIKVDITEGQRVRIKDLHFTGRMSRPESYYSEFVRENSSKLIDRGFYNRADLEKGHNNLITELRNQGFLRAKIQSSRLEYLNTEGDARVIAVLDEGPLTQVLSLTFEGAKAFSHQELANAVGIKSGSPLRLGELERAVDEVKDFYKNHGYLEMRLLNETEDLIEYNEAGTQARIRFHIYEGPKVIVNAIRIEGNTFTKSDVILRTIDIERGEVLTPEKIDDSELQLNRLGVFNRASIRTLEEGTNVSQRTVLITVVERDPGTFRFGVGVNSERNLTVRGFSGLSYNNLFGTGRALSGRVELKSHVVEVDYLQHEVAAGYLEPFLFGTRTRGRVNLTRSDRVFEFEAKDDQTQITTSNKVELLAERDLTRHTRLSWKLWSMDSRKQFERFGRCIPGKGQNFDPASRCGPTTQQISTLGPIIDVDYRDHPFLPTRGSHSHLSVDYSDPSFGSSSGIQFIRTEGGYTTYTPVMSTEYIWQNSLRAGYVANLSNADDSGVPTSHAFFLGGISTIRGFGGTNDIERIPSGRDVEVQAGNQKLIKKDSHFFLIKSEMRFTILGSHGGAVFYDGGLVQITGERIIRPYRDAVGFGYRYNTPVGPLSIDIAFKLNPRTYSDAKESPFRIHFSVGTF